MAGYLHSIVLTRILPCLAEPGRIIVVGKPDRSLDEVLPYLANLPGVVSYNPEAWTLTFRRKPGFLTLYADKVFLTQVKDSEEGMALLGALVDAINATWDHRSEITAVHVRKQALQHLDIYAQLPQTNCKKCGEATCLAFAILLVQQKHRLEECVPLQNDSAFSDRRAALEAML